MDMSKLETFDKTTVTSRLVRWGSWKMRSGVALGYAPMAAFMRLSGGGGTVGGIADEIDSECVQTDGAVEKLTYFPQVVIRVEYMIGVDKRRDEKARTCGISKSTYYDYLQVAHAQVANNLNLMLRSPDKSDINLLNVSKVRLA